MAKPKKPASNLTDPMALGTHPQAVEAKSKAGRPRLYDFPTSRIMVTIPTSDKIDVQNYARQKMVDALIGQKSKSKK